MPVYEHDKDRPDSVEARASQEDPWVMYLVARKAHGASLEGFLVASARATLDVVVRYSGDARYATACEEWSARSFRKVCLRANEKEWPRVSELDAGVGEASGEVVIRALPPRKKSERERLLVQLQAYTAEPSELASRAVAVEGDAPVLALVVNDTVPMRVGKLAAQVGHAAVLAVSAFSRDERGAEEFAAWYDAGARTVVRRADASAWEELKRYERCALVRDAGITEIAKGSETILALRPCAPSEWSERVRALAPV